MSRSHDRSSQLSHDRGAVPDQGPGGVKLGGTDSDSPQEQPRCGLCAHTMTMERCGWAAAGDVPLCHADDHSCYKAWTLYTVRPGEPWPPFGCGADPR